MVRFDFTRKIRFHFFQQFFRVSDMYDCEFLVFQYTNVFLIKFRENFVFGYWISQNLRFQYPIARSFRSETIWSLQVVMKFWSENEDFENIVKIFSTIWWNSDEGEKVDEKKILWPFSPLYCSSELRKNKQEDCE